MKPILLFALTCLLSVSVETQQSSPTPPRALHAQDVMAISIPAAVRQNVSATLEYRDTDTIKGVLFDLNEDGISDYIVQSSASLCGTGGCGYSIVDGASRNRLGDVFGDPLYVLATKVRGYFVIETYGHLNARSGKFVTYEFGGTAYTVRTTQLVEGASVDSLFAKLDRIPRWRPRP